MTDDFGMFSVSSIIASLIFGVIGIWLFRVGKKNLNHSLMIIGICLMAYPYFTKGPLADWGIGVILCGAAYFLW